jgi:hypothetical protein
MLHFGTCYTASFRTLLIKLLLFIACLLSLLSYPLLANAQPALLDYCRGGDNNRSVPDLRIFCPTEDSIDTVEKSGAGITYVVLALIMPFLYLAISVATVALIYGGYKYIMSTGDEAEAKKAKRIVLYAIVGLLVIAISGTVVNAFILWVGATP